jgi:iron complex outermembrane receptor protein
MNKSCPGWSGPFLAMTASTLIGISSPALSSTQTIVQQVPDSVTSSNLVNTSKKPDESDQLQEITVTAQRRTENLQKVPIAITVVTNEQLVQSGIQSSSDLAAVVPGLVLQSSENGLQPHLRGVGTTAIPSGTENSIAAYVDGVYMLSLDGGILQLDDVQQVEVLKGPRITNS